MRRTKKQYDDRGNLISCKDNGISRKFEYDEKDNCIHEIYGDDHETWWDYDDRGNCIRINDSDGYERHYEYDENGKCIGYKDSEGNSI